MDFALARRTADQHGFFLRSQALDCGYSEKEIAALLRSGQWVRLRRGAYAARETFDALDDAGRHVLVSRATAHRLTGRVVLTGYSGLAALGGPLWGVDLAQVHVHRDAGKTSRREAGVVHHVGDLPDSEVVEVDGLLVARPERCAFEVCRRTPFEAAVALVDGIRHRHAFALETAQALVERYRDWSGSIGAARVLRFSTDKSETVGESRARVLLARIGLPAPVLQHPMRNARGTLLGVTDFYFEQFATVGEFDGRVKYGRALYERDGRVQDVDLGDVVWREKRREDSIRDEGHELVRIVWQELAGHDQTVQARFLRAFERAGRRRAS